MVSEMSVTGRLITYDFTYVWNLKGKINKETEKKILDTWKNWWLPDRRGVRGLGENGEGIKYTLAATK